MHILIIGSGPAGTQAALSARKAGHDVTLFEKGRLGGVCLNEGCIPTKTLLEDSHHLITAQQFHAFNPFECAQSVIDHKIEVIDDLRAALTQTLSQAKVEVIHKSVHFIDDETLEDEDGQRYTADQIVIATGAKPAKLALPCSTDVRLHDSRSLLDAIFTKKTRFAMIGGGVIGCELAAYLKMMGHVVTIIDIAPTLLGMAPKDLAQGISRDFKQNGIDVMTSTTIQSIDKIEDHYRITTPQTTLVVDEIVVAAGRTPQVEGLGLEHTKVRIEKGHIVVDDKFQTHSPKIFALGDVNGSIQLAHVADHQARLWASQSRQGPTSSALPNVIYTPLQAAWVGMTEEASKADPSLKVYRCVLSANAKQKIKLGTRGTLKWVVDEHHHLVGAEILSADAGELIGTCALLIDLKADLRTLKSSILPHPSLIESFHLILDQLPSLGL